MIEYLTIIISLLALAYAGILTSGILKQDAGSLRMREIADVIREGAMAYTARQYKTIAIFAVIIIGVLGYFFVTPIATGF